MSDNFLDPDTFFFFFFFSFFMEVDPDTNLSELWVKYREIFLFKILNDECIRPYNDKFYSF
jgi:hypothetical protein